MKERWLVVQEMIASIPEEKAKIAYMVVHEWPTFATFDDAINFIKKKKLPLGWVTMQESQLSVENRSLVEKLEHTEEWYAVRMKLLEDWFREHGKKLPIATAFWNIVANGTKDVFAPPTYQQQLNRAKHELELSEKTVEETRQQLLALAAKLK